MMNQDLITLILLLVFKTQFLSDYDIALKNLNEQYRLSIVDYKLYHPNLLGNDTYIYYYQKTHCEFNIVKLKMTLKKKQ